MVNWINGGVINQKSTVLVWCLAVYWYPPGDGFNRRARSTKVRLAARRAPPGGDEETGALAQR